MNQFSLNKFISSTLIILVILSFFFGFYLDESSFGAGGYNGDFEHVYTNLEFFLKQDLATSLANPAYHDSRPPTSYILHEALNPFAEEEINYRRSVKKSIQATMSMGAEGIKIRVAGRLNGIDIARQETFKEGRIPLHTLRSNIDYAHVEALTTYGIIGVKVWIFKGEIR